MDKNAAPEIEPDPGYWMLDTGLARYSVDFIKGRRAKRLLTGMATPKFGESQHIREMSIPAAAILAICPGLAWPRCPPRCDLWQERYKGHKICYPIFRNPDGTPEKNNEYLTVTNLDIYEFSPID